MLTGAGIGVILVQTREPHRTQDVLRKIAQAKQRPFKVWDTVHGWRQFKDDPKKDPDVTPAPDAYKALLHITDDSHNWDDAFCVMHYTHWAMPKVPGLIQCLKHYVRFFADKQTRLVLLVPEGFSPPPELQNDLTVMDFPLPSNEEIEESLENIIESGLPEGQSSSTIFTKEEVTALVSNAAGMTELEAENSFGRAIIANKDKWPSDITFEDFNKVLLECKTDVVKRSELLELIGTVSFDEVEGMDLFKSYIEHRKLAFTKEARDFGVDVPKGIMTIGPPGTGKSLGAKATAHCLGLPLIKFDVSKVFAGIVGESE